MFVAKNYMTCNICSSFLLKLFNSPYKNKSWFIILCFVILALRFNIKFYIKHWWRKDLLKNRTRLNWLICDKYFFFIPIKFFIFKIAKIKYSLIYPWTIIYWQIPHVYPRALGLPINFDVDTPFADLKPNGGIKFYYPVLFRQPQTPKHEKSTLIVKKVIKSNWAEKEVPASKRSTW